MPGRPNKPEGLPPPPPPPPPVPARRSRWEKYVQPLLTASIPAIAAVAAAVLTVQASGDATLQGVREQGKQQIEAIRLTAQQQADRDAAAVDRDAATVEQHARGAARVLFTELLVSAYAMTDIAEGVYWFKPFGKDYPVQMPSADLQLIAARLSPIGYRKVSVALSNIDGLGRYVAQRARQAPYATHPLTRHSIEIIARDVRTLRMAAGPVAKLGKLSGVSFPRLPVNAAWRNVLRTIRKHGFTRPS